MINLGHQNSSWRAGVVVDFVDNFTGPVMDLIKDLSEKASTSLKINPNISMPRVPKLNVQSNVKVNPESVTKAIQNVINEYEGMDRMLSYAELSDLTKQLTDIAKSFESLNMNMGGAKKLIKDDTDAAEEYIHSIENLLAVKDDLSLSNLDDLIDPSVFESILAPLDKAAEDISKKKQNLVQSISGKVKAPAKDAGVFATVFAPWEKLGDNKKFTDLTGNLSDIGNKINQELDLVYDDAGKLEIDKDFALNLVKDDQSAEAIIDLIDAVNSKINDVTLSVDDTEGLKKSFELLDADQLDLLKSSQDEFKQLVILFEHLGDVSIEHLDPKLRKRFDKVLQKSGIAFNTIYDKMNHTIADTNFSFAKHTNVVGKSLNKAIKHLNKYEERVEDVSKKIEDSAINRFIQQPAVKKISLAGAAVLGGSMLLSATNEEQLQAARETQLLTEGTIKPMDASFRLSEIHDIAVEMNIGESGDNLNMMVLAMKRYEDVLDSAKLKGTEFSGQSMKDFSSMMAIIVGADNFSADLGKEIMTGLELYQGMSASVVKQVGDNDDMFRRAVIATLEGVELHEMDQAQADIIFAETPGIALTDEQMKDVHDKLKEVRKAQHDHFTESAKVMGNTFQNLGSSVTEFSYNYGLIGPVMKGVNRTLTEANIAIHKFAESQSGATKFAVGIGTTAVASLFAVGKAFPAIAETTAHTLTAMSVVAEHGKKLKALGGAALTGAKHIGKLGSAVGSGAKLITNFSGVTKLAGVFTNLFSASTVAATASQRSYNMSVFGSIKALITSTAAKIGNTAATVAQAVATWAAVVPTWALAAAAIGLTAALLIVVGIGYLIYKNWDKITAAFKAAWEWVKNLAKTFFEFGKNLLYSLKPVQWLSTAFGWLMNALGLTGKESDGFMDKLWRIAKLIFYLFNPIGWLIGSFKILNKVFGTMEGSSNPIIRAVGKIGKIFVNFLNPIGLLINAFKWLSRIWKGSGDEGEGFISKITRVGKAILMVASPIGLAVAAFKSLASIFTNMEGSSNPIISTIGKIGKILFTVLTPISLVTNAFNWLKNIWKGSGDESEGFVAKILRIGKTIFMLSTPLGWIISAFKYMSNMFTKMAGSGNPVISTIGKIGSVFISFLNPIKLVSKIFQGLSRIWKGSGDESESFIAKILRVGKTIFMLGTPLGLIITGITKLIKYKSAVIGFFKGIGSGVKGFIGNIGSVLKNVLTGIQGFMGSVIDFFRNAFADLVNMFIGWINNAINIANKVPGVNIDLIPTMGENGEQSIKLTPEYAEAADNGILKKIGSAIPFQDSKVATGLNKLSKNYVDAFKEPKQAAKQMWSDVVDNKAVTKINDVGTSLWSKFETTQAGQSVKNLANQYIQAFKEPEQAVKQFWDNLRGSKVKDIGSSLMSGFNINPLKGGVSDVTKFYANAFKDPEQAIKQMWDTLSNNKVARSAMNTVDKLWGRFSETKIGRKVDQNVRQIWNTLGDNRFVKSYVDSANYLFSSLGAGFKEQGVLGAFNKFVEIQKVSFSKMWGSFKDRATYRFMDNLFNKVVTTTNMSGLNIGRFFKRIFAPVSRFAGKVINLFVKFFKEVYSTISGKIQGILDSIWQTLSSVGSVLSDIFSSVFDFLSGIFKSLFSNISSWFKSLGSGLVDLISTVFSSLLEWLQSPFSNTYKFAMDIFNLIYSGLGSIFNSISSKLKEPFIFVSGLVSSIFSSLFSTIVSGFNFVSNLLKKPFVTVGNFIGNIFSSLFTKIVSSFSIIGDFLKKPFIAIKDIIHGAVDFMRTALIDLVNMFINGINKVLETANKLPGVNIDLLPTLKAEEQSFNIKTTSDDGSSGSTDDGNGLLKQIGGFFSNIGSDLLPDIGSDADGGGLFKKAGKFFGGIGSSIMSGIDSMSDSVAPSSPVLAMPSAPVSNYAAVGSDIINRDNRLVNPDLLREYELAMSDFSNHRMQNENINVNVGSETSVNGSVDVTVNFSNMPAGSVAKVESKGQVNMPKVRSGSLSGAQKRNLGNSGGSNN